MSFVFTIEADEEWRRKRLSAAMKWLRENLTGPSGFEDLAALRDEGDVLRAKWRQGPIPAAAVRALHLAWSAALESPGARVLHLVNDRVVVRDEGGPAVRQQAK